MKLRVSAFLITFALVACTAPRAEERAEVVSLTPSSNAGATEGEAANQLQAGSTEGRARTAQERRPTPAPTPAPQPALRQIAENPEAPPFDVELTTTEGVILLHVHPEWAPLGAARFRELVEDGFFTDVAFFRVIQGFMAQGGIHGDPAVARRWRNNSIQDDPVVQTNARGTVSFATRGPNTRTTQFFINFSNNNRLDRMGFSPFAVVDAESMSVVDALYADYGEGAPRGRGPDQMRIQSEGNAYLRADFPELDYIQSARVVP